MRHNQGCFDVVGRSSGGIAGKVSLRFAMLKYFIKKTHTHRTLRPSDSFCQVDMAIRPFSPHSYPPSSAFLARPS